MLRTVDSIKGYAIRATDDELGEVEELYFDDVQWGVRYLVVKTGSWFTRQRVLISPYSVTGIDHADRAVQVALTREQVKNSPDIDTHQPVSRQMEREHATYYGYGMYWTGPYLWGVGGYPTYPLPEAGTVPPAGTPVQDSAELDRQQTQENDEDVHLRSTENVGGYAIAGSDGDIGHVEDFIFDDESWAIRYLVVDTRNWWPGGKKVLLATQWIEDISWTESAVQTRLTQEQIKNSPEYDEDMSLDREFETRLHHHYGRPGYWDL